MSDFLRLIGVAFVVIFALGTLDALLKGQFGWVAFGIAFTVYLVWILRSTWDKADLQNREHPLYRKRLNDDSDL